MSLVFDLELYQDLPAQLRKIDALIAATEERIQTLSTKREQLRNQKEEIRMRISQESAEKLSSIDWHRMDHPWSQQVQETLQTVFKLEELKHHQLSTINAIMSKQDAILIMPTGGGKSLCYQLPALLLPGTTLVISPLISLMEDQVMSLRALDIEAELTYISKTKTEMLAVEKSMMDSNCKIKILYASPEKLAKSKRFMSRLEKMYQTGRLSLIAIDEVHCCSQWGHDFRPDYKFLGILRRQFPHVPILGVTATAPSKVVCDVQQILNIDGCLVIKAPLHRPNLKYEVIPKSSNHKEVVDGLAKMINTRFKNESGIVYCFTVKECEEIASDLKNRNVKAQPYHAQLDPAFRKRVHLEWSRNNVKVVVATIAFGMGIDKPDVRFVIHHSTSKSMENFYQESGRAGRDDEPAHCILMFRFADIFRQSVMVFTERTGLEKLYSMIAYCTDTSRCRREIVAQHFGEPYKPSDCNKMCDNCINENRVVTEEVDVTNVCKLLYDILNHASSIEERMTAQKLLDALLGKGPTKLRPLNARPISLPRDLCETIIALLLLEGYLKEEFHFTSYTTISYLNLGPKSPWVLGGRGSIVLNLPSKKRKAPKESDPTQMSKIASIGCSPIEMNPSKVRLATRRESFHFLKTESDSESDDDDILELACEESFGKLK